MVTRAPTFFLARHDAGHGIAPLSVSMHRQIRMLLEQAGAHGPQSAHMLKAIRVEVSEINDVPVAAEFTCQVGAKKLSTELQTQVRGKARRKVQQDLKLPFGLGQLKTQRVVVQDEDQDIDSSSGDSEEKPAELGDGDVVSPLESPAEVSTDEEQPAFPIGIMDWDIAPSSRAVCFCCNERVAKGEFRFSYRTTVGSSMRFQRYIHAVCVRDLPLESRQADFKKVRRVATKPAKPLSPEAQRFLDDSVEALNPDHVTASGSGG